jgi:hypothetical protein
MKSEFLQQFLTAEDLHGNTLAPLTIVVLLALWTEIDVYALLAYKERSAQAPVLVVSKRQLLKILPIADASTVDRHVRALRRARWLAVGDASGNGQLYVQLFDRIDRGRIIARGISGSTYDPRCSKDEHNDRRSLQDLKAIPAGFEGDLGRILTTETRPSSTGFNKNINTPPTPPGGRGALDEFEQSAIEILQRAIAPRGCVAIPATPHGARYLAEQLRGGWSVAEARRLVAAMPGIVERGVREAKYYAANAFKGDRFDWWLTALAEYEALLVRETSRGGGGTEPIAETRPRGPAVTIDELDELAVRFS